jgi:hypothetical protein
MAIMDTPPTVAQHGEGVTLPLDTLRAWLGGALAATPGKKDPHGDTLRVVRIERGSEGGTVAIGTDAYSLAALKVEIGLHGDGFTVPADDLAAALKACGKVKKDTREATLASSAGEWSLTVSDGKRFGGPLSAQPFPGWRQLLTYTSGFEPAAFGLVTFARAVDVLAAVGGNASIQWDAMAARTSACGYLVRAWNTPADRISGRVLVMPVRTMGDPEPPTL